MSFTVYKSSAGSGKTYTLVKEYLKIVLMFPAKFRNILAITFTNKAANEMKERIISNLIELSATEPDKNSITNKYLLPELISDLKIDTETITKRSSEALELILHNYSDFAIGTIDSFVHKIIRIFAHDLHLPLNFDVEMDEDTLISQAIDLLISRVGTDEKLTKVLVRFTEDKTENEQNWNIEKDLQTFAKSLLKEDGQYQIEKLKKLTLNDFLKINKKILENIKKFEDSVKEKASIAIQLIHKNDVSISSFYYGNQGIGKYFNNLYNGDFEKIKPNSRVIQTIEENKWYSGKTDDYQKSAIDNIKSELKEIYLDIEKIIINRHGKYMVLKLLRRNIYPLAVLNEIEKILNEIKTQNNIVHISEFNKRIADIVLNEPVPFIYERLGEKYKYFLIDEFQDTSVLQWHNLLPLIDNSLSEDNFNMLVGDGKQAIYRWRNGEVEQFAKLPKIFKKENNPYISEREQNLIRNYNSEELKKNYRSKAEIVDFNNKFFKVVASLIKPPYDSIYENLEQEFETNNTGGYINIDFIDKKNAEDSFEEINFKKIKEIILELQQQNFNWGDIAILCRKNKEASNIARFLLNENIDVISSESLLLSSSHKLNFIIALIKFMLDPSDNIQKTHILNFLKQNNQESFRDKLFISKLRNLQVFDLCEELIRLFGLNSQPDPYIQFFLDAVLKFTIENNSGVSDFIDWWEEKKDKLSIIVPEGINAVNILTIHKAKGLEFPVIIYPFANESSRMTKKELWVDLNEPEIPEMDAALLPAIKDMEDTSFADLYVEEKNKSFLDMINLLYVVMTRPTDRLYILTEKPSENPKEINSLSHVFVYYLKSEGLWLENTTEYSFGNEQFFKRIIKPEDKSIFKLESFISEDWRRKILISTSAPEIWDVSDPDRNKEWGNLVHALLANIITYDDVENAVEDFFSKGIIDKTEKDKLLEKIKQLVMDPRVKPFFEKNLNIKTETEILLPNGQTFRPDRLILSENKAIVIDYKTGKAEEKHKKQINHYARLIEEMGYNEVEKYLLYIDDEVEVVRV